MALALGFFGSWHCLGMCGPIALGVNSVGYSWLSKVISPLSYNIGRVISYSFLGLVIGLFGSLINFSGLQQSLSIIAGIFLIFLFIVSLDLEHYLYRFDVFKKAFDRVHKKIIVIAHKFGSSRPIYLGLINGFLPCGMVYLALAGALMAGDLIGGVQFMFFFGLGTIPALFGLIVMKELLKGKIKFAKLRSVLPFLQLALGIYLIYRGLSVDFPEQLDFSLGIKNPILCH